MGQTPDQGVIRNTVPCPYCHTETLAGAKFCERCGAALIPACPACGSPLKRGIKFCGSCGQPVSLPPPPPAEPPSPPDGPPAAPAAIAICLRCGDPFKPGVKFCEGCGTPVGVSVAPPPPPVPTAPACPVCGSPLKPGLKFCESCGAPVEAAPAAPPPTAAAPVCARCGLPLKPGIRFCGSCGQPVGEAVQWAAPAPVPSQAAEVAAPRGRTRAAKPTPAPRRSGSRLGGALRGCATVLIIILVALVALYFAFRSGILTEAKLLGLVGLGPGTIEVINLRDDAIQASITPLSESDDTTEESPESTLDLKEFEFGSFGAPRPGKYRVEIEPNGKSAATGVCTLTVRSGDLYRFIALADGVMVNRANSPSTKGEDLVLETSAFCR